MHCLKEPSQSRLSFPWHILELAAAAAAAFQERVHLFLCVCLCVCVFNFMLCLTGCLGHANLSLNTRLARKTGGFVLGNKHRKGISTK